MPEIFFMIHQSAGEVPLAASVLKASHRACVGKRGHVRVCAGKRGHAQACASVC